MPTSPDITVVTCIYNKGDRIERTMQSILKQTYPHWRYIVINDGSTDNTREILSKFDDPRIEVIDQPNRGFCVTMADVMRNVTTPLVAIQGAGDWSEPPRFEMQRDFLTRHVSVGAVGCGVDVCRSDGERIRTDRALALEIYSSPSEFHGRHRLSHGEVMMRMSAYEQAGGYRALFTYGQDLDLWLRMLLHCSIGRLDQCLYKQIVSAEDVSAHPKKILKQAQFCDFAILLSQQDEHRLSGKGHAELKQLFEEFVSKAGPGRRWHWARRATAAVRNVSPSRDEYDSVLATAMVVVSECAARSPAALDIRLRLALRSSCRPLHNMYAYVVQMLAFLKAKIA